MEAALLFSQHLSSPYNMEARDDKLGRKLCVTRLSAPVYGDV